MMTFPTYSAQSEQYTAAMVSALPQIIGNSTTDDKTLVLPHDFHANSSAFSQNQSHQQNQDQGFNFTEGHLCHQYMDPKTPTQYVSFANREYVPSSPSELSKDCDCSGHPGSFSHEDITTTIMDDSVLDICNNSQATHQLVVGSSSLASGPQPAETDILCLNGEYVKSWSTSVLLTDCDNSGHPGSFSQEYSHEDITTTIMDGSVLDICNNSQATHQLVVGSSSLASGPQPAETDILCPNVEGRTRTRTTYHMKYTPQDVENLINGVEKYSNKGRINWKSIKKLDYFNDTPRKKDQLKDKWRHMVKSADTEADPLLKELYMRAKNIDADLQKNKKKKDSNFSL